MADKRVMMAAVAGLVALVAVSVLTAPPLIRAVLSVASVSPLIFLTVRDAVRVDHWILSERRKDMALRGMTNEFLIMVRSLNRLKVIAMGDEEIEEAEDMLDEIEKQMHDLVERLKGAAGDLEFADGAHGGQLA